jgi:hypothetical protein
VTTQPATILLIHAAACWFMVGVIWFVQLVHYPLFGGVGEDGFVAYAADHSRRTTWVVAPAMLIELGTGVLLLTRRPEGIGWGWPVAGLALLGLVWGSTALAQVPRHRRLGAAAWRGLVATNWVRTGAWSVRGLLVLAMLDRAVR